METKDEHNLIKPVISFEQLIQIFNSSYDGIMVTDKSGNIIFATPSTSFYMGVSLDDLIGYNIADLMERGVYDNSVALKAIKSKKQQTGIVKVFNGNRTISTSTPIFDNNKEIVMTITNVRVENLIDKYAKELEKEKTNVRRYKSAINYISSLNENSNKVIADSPQMKKILEYLTRASKTDSTILLLGESGTGKDVLSRFIHENSRRAKEPFIPVNCAAIPKELMESEFFGYEKGAFSGALAKGKPGFFEIADQGTLFLDEVAEMSMSIQSKFLRIIETGEFQRLGGTSFISTNVRIIAATNKNLRQKVEDGTFREDLYYRLNVIPVNIPPLRERKEDIAALSQFFIDKINSKYGTERELSNSLIEKLMEYDWPGNIRELRNIIERLVLTFNENDIISADSIGIQSVGNITGNNSSNKEVEEGLENIIQDHKGSLKSLTKIVEKEYIEKVLNECNWKISDASKVLGLHRSMVYRKIQEFNIEKKNSDNK